MWTYLVTLGGWIGGPVRLEYVALALALVLSVAGVVLVMLGTGRLYAPGLRGRRALLLPAGALVYIAHPAGPRLRDLRARKRFGAGLSRPAVVDDGVLVAGAARRPGRADEPPATRPVGCSTRRWRSSPGSACWCGPSSR